jgi:hypothetical protein
MVDLLLRTSVGSPRISILVERKVAMTRSRTEMMVARLREMQAASPDIEASAVVSVDGLIMASALPADVEEDRVSAMSAAMISLGERIASELGRGGLEQVYIRGGGGYLPGNAPRRRTPGEGGGMIQPGGVRKRTGAAL